MDMTTKQLSIEGVKELQIPAFEDDRGFMARWFDRKQFAEHLGVSEWSQVSHSFTAQKNTLRA